MVYQDRDARWFNGVGVRVGVEDDCSVSVCVTHRDRDSTRTHRVERPVAMVGELVRFIEDCPRIPESAQVWALQRLHVAALDAAAMERTVMYRPDAADTFLSWYGLVSLVAVLAGVGYLLWG